MSVPTTSAEVSIKSNSGSNSNSKPSSNAGGIERRRRKRAKISAQVHVRVMNSPEPFEEVCKSLDVSRDGLLFLSARAGYWKGQQLEVTFPYSTAAAEFNTPQKAEVVRVESGNGQHGVAVQFAAAKADAKSELKSAPSGAYGSNGVNVGNGANQADPFAFAPHSGATPATKEASSAAA